MTIKVPNQYSVYRARRWIRGSLQAHGEQAILLPIYHPSRAEDGTRCPRCTDDIYTGGKASCSICYGTAFVGGPREARRVWALFSDTKRPETPGQRGVWAADAREIQTEAFPELREHDYVARIKSWDITGTIPQEVYAIYAVGEVNQDSLRTGARFGQFHDDVVGQRAPVTKLAANIKIYDYPLVGVTFAGVSWDNQGRVIQG